jgi:hypothetical protein
MFQVVNIFTKTLTGFTLIVQCHRHVVNPSFLAFFHNILALLLALILGIIIPITRTKRQKLAETNTYLTQGIACGYSGILVPN